MKKINAASMIIAVFMVLSICSFFVCPLPDFSVTVDGFAEHKVMYGRFMLITPLRGDYSYVNNHKKIPRFKYISANDRIKIKQRLDYFKENITGEPLLFGASGLQKLVIATEGEEYISLFDRSVTLNGKHITNGYNKDSTYDGAVELWIATARSAPFFATDTSILLTNTWLWLYGDRCIGVSEKEKFSDAFKEKIVTPNRVEQLIESLVVRYLE